ncbi:MAG: hypothetical protein HC781_06415 [Leptolyngbyaceae cyanobacterium CSU_1_4]|nr:hypothetical protein [Leptolyngbyaceae cyanobacterium CSU_1_4]
MPGTQQATIVLSVVAQGTIEKGRAIGWNAQQAGDGGGNGVAIMAIADHRAVLGEAVRAIAGATAMAESGALIDGTETRLKTDAQGRFIPWTTGSVVAARLMPGSTATGAGQTIEVFPIQS